MPMLGVNLAATKPKLEQKPKMVRAGSDPKFDNEEFL